MIESFAMAERVSKQYLGADEVLDTIKESRENPSMRRLLRILATSEGGASLEEVLTRFRRLSRRVNEGREICEGDEIMISPTRISDLVQAMINRGVVQLNPLGRYDLTAEARSRTALLEDY